MQSHSPSDIPIPPTDPNNFSRSVALYLRVSSEEQTEKGTIDNQRSFAEGYCKLHEIPIADWYADEGVSGATPLDQRPEGARLLRDAQAGKFSAVLVYRIDRLGRRLLPLLQTMKTLEGMGVAVRSMTEPFDTSTAIGRFLLSLMGSLAELERETIAERSALGRARVAREGRWNGGTAPLGYSVGADQRLQVNEEEAALVRRIFRPLHDRSVG